MNWLVICLLVIGLLQLIQFGLFVVLLRRLKSRSISHSGGKFQPGILFGDVRHVLERLVEALNNNVSETVEFNLGQIAWNQHHCHIGEDVADKILNVLSGLELIEYDSTTMTGVIPRHSEDVLRALVQRRHLPASTR